MAHQFCEYEIVQINNRADLPPAAVRGWNETGEVYDLRFLNGQEIQVPEENLTATGQFETPFRFYELVEIHPRRDQEETKQDKQEGAILEGARGVVTGIAVNDDIGVWGFSVVVQNGENWYLEEEELKSLGKTISEEKLYASPNDSEWVRLHYNPTTGEQTVVAGDPSFLHRGPTPLLVDLNAL